MTAVKLKDKLCHLRKCELFTSSLHYDRVIFVVILQLHVFLINFAVPFIIIFLLMYYYSFPRFNLHFLLVQFPTNFTCMDFKSTSFALNGYNGILHFFVSFILQKI